MLGVIQTIINRELLFHIRYYTSICKSLCLFNKDLYKHSLIGIDPQHHHMAKEHFDQRKTKRVRTSFKHYQIQLMKQAFAEKPNPDSNDLKKLSNQTGLAKRVLQVKTQLRSHLASSIWFSGVVSECAGQAA